MVELLRKDKSLSSMLYNRDLDRQALGLLTAHLQHLDKTREKIFLRRYKSNMEVFKISKSSSSQQLFFGTMIVLAILGGILVMY